MFIAVLVLICCGSWKEGRAGLGKKETGCGSRLYQWGSEATHGIATVVNDATTPHETNFAFPITTAMSFNRSLWHATGARIGREVRAGR